LIDDGLCLPGGGEPFGVQNLSADPLVTIGAHTVNHFMLKKVESEQTVRKEWK
jgi:hypothetical protein